MSTQPLELRPSVLAFAQAMEARLHLIPLPPTMTVDELIDHADTQLDHLGAAWHDSQPDFDADATADRAVAVAVAAMTAWDRVIELSKESR